jgi:orotate phosphoribosyltransferase
VKLDVTDPFVTHTRSRKRCSPQHVLLIDDVYTTGSHINSVAVALFDAGHDMCGAFVIARRVNPKYQPADSNFWAHQTSQSWSLPTIR